jgi:hypothetical protein
MKAFISSVPHLLLTASVVSILQSCELKKDESPTPTDPPVNTDTLVMKPGKGFSTVAILPSAFDGSTGANGAFSDGMAPVDMSLLPNGKTLYFSTLSSLQSQQDPILALKFYSMDLDNKAITEEAVPTLAQSTANNPMEPWTNLNPSGQVFKNKSTGYLEGTKDFYQGSVSFNNFGVGTSTVGGAFSYTRTNTFAQMPRVTAGGQVVEGVFSEILTYLDGRKNNRIFGNYRKANREMLPLNMSQVLTSTAACVSGGEIEPKALNSDELWFFWASFTHLFVAEINAVGDLSGNTPFVNVDSIPLPAGFPSGFSETYHPYTFITRRSDDGNSFGILLRNTHVDSRFVSASFSTVTRKLTKNLDGISIPGGLGGTTNFDIDPSGNVYFDGWANNFQSDSTISIYKASGGGIASVGEDLLKSGSIKQIRYMNGKIYAAVYYAYRKNPTVANAVKYHRIALLKQD